NIHVRPLFRPVPALESVIGFGDESYRLQTFDRYSCDQVHLRGTRQGSRSRVPPPAPRARLPVVFGGKHHDSRERLDPDLQWTTDLDVGGRMSGPDTTLLRVRGGAPGGPSGTRVASACGVRDLSRADGVPPVGPRAARVRLLGRRVRRGTRGSRLPRRY